MLQRRKRTSCVSGKGERQRKSQHASAETKAFNAAGCRSPVGEKEQQHEDKGQKIAADGSRYDGGAACFDVALRRRAQQHYDDKDRRELLYKVYERRLPHSAAGGEVAAHGGGERYERHGDRKDAQRLYRPCVAYPKKADGFGKASEQQEGGNAEAQGIGKAAPHRRGDRRISAAAKLLGDEPCCGKAHAGDGEGAAQKADGQHKSEETYPGSADAHREPHPIRHGNKAHQQGGAGEQSGIKNQTLFSDHGKAYESGRKICVKTPEAECLRRLS